MGMVTIQDGGWNCRDRWVETAGGGGDIVGYTFCRGRTHMVASKGGALRGRGTAVVSGRGSVVRDWRKLVGVETLSTRRIAGEE